MIDYTQYVFEIRNTGEQVSYDKGKVNNQLKNKGYKLINSQEFFINKEQGVGYRYGQEHTLYTWEHPENETKYILFSILMGMIAQQGVWKFPTIISKEELDKLIEYNTLDKFDGEITEEDEIIDSILISRETSPT